MHEHHYLGFRSLVGVSICYVALFEGHWLSLLGWSAAALKRKVRDQWIGWPSAIKLKRLALLANNTRFLPPPNTIILSINLKRLSEDWQRIYDHPAWRKHLSIPVISKGHVIRRQDEPFGVIPLLITDSTLKMPARKAWVPVKHKGAQGVARRMTKCNAIPPSGNAETCNGIDEICDGVTDDGFDVGDSCIAGEQCE